MAFVACFWGIRVYFFNYKLIQLLLWASWISFGMSEQMSADCFRKLKCSILALNIEKSDFRCLGFKPIFDSKELRLIFRLRLLDQTVNKGLNLNLNLKEHLCHTLSQRISLISTLQLKTTSDWMPNHPIRITYLTICDFSEEFENPSPFWKKDDFVKN